MTETKVTTGDLKEAVLKALVNEFEKSEELQASVVNAAVNFLKAFHSSGDDIVDPAMSDTLKKYTENFNHTSLN